MFDVVIPTMWQANDLFLEALESYRDQPLIDRIWIVDNSGGAPRSLRRDDRVEIIRPGSNIYVNPAWNMAVGLGHGPVICLVNDDVVVHEDAWQFMAQQPWNDIGLVGRCMQPRDRAQVRPITIDTSLPVGAQLPGFGTCLWLSRRLWRPIPSLYQVWFGDDWLIQHTGTVHHLESTWITGDMSRTIDAQPSDSVIRRRIDLDTRNAHRYLMRSAPQEFPS